MSDTPESDKWIAGYDDNACTLDAHAIMQSLERQRDAYAETLRQVITDCSRHTSVDPDAIIDVIRERHPELGNAKSAATGSEGNDHE